ncbi:hypothetical protein ACJ41O_001117 [Fusarium nematophilum]
MDLPRTSPTVNVAALPTYSHTPLSRPDQEIRLLELLPGKPDDRIHVKIHHSQIERVSSPPSTRKNLKAIQATLSPGWLARETIDGRYIFISQDQDMPQWDHPDPDFDRSLYEAGRPEEVHPQFEALSYAWGTEPPCDFIIVQGETDAKIEVRPNLLGALQQLRNTDSPRTLWIDAICINQDDYEERKVQVGWMATIYRSSYRVIVWLGPEENDSDIALSALREIGQQTALLVDWSRTLSPDATSTTWYLPQTPIPYSQDTWTAIGHLLDRPWFKRLWVVQEFKFGNSRSVMQCGKEAISFPLFRQATVCLSEKLEKPEEISWPNLFQASQLAYSSNKLSFRVMMSQVSMKLCSDPRDRIYGVLSLAPRGLVAEVQADYTKDLGEVFRDVSLAHAKHVGRLEMFHQCNQTLHTIPLPSWVPDWTSYDGSELFVDDQFAAAFSQAEFSFTAPNLLTVTGLQCATVSECLTPVPLDATAAERIRIVRSWQPDDLETGAYVTGETLRMAHAKAIYFNDFEERFPGLQLQPDEATWEAQGFDCPLFGSDLEDVPDSYQVPPEDRDTSNALLRCSGRRYIRTSEGHIGVAPLHTQEEDIVAVFLGCSRPVILHPSPNGQWTLVGECFILGLNDAISLLGPLPQPWRVRAFFGNCERYLHRFFNPDTGEVTPEDPRLKPLADWERIEHEVELDDPETYDYFRHRVTGEVTAFDPRMRADALRARGVDLRKFELV